MKICPTCQSTYTDDSLAYCLADGAILSTLRNQHETLRIPAAQNTDPAPTEILSPASRPSDSAPTLQPTIPASPRPHYPESQRAHAPEKRGRSVGLILGVGVLIGIVLAVVIAVSVRETGNSNAIENRSESKISNTNARPTATPTATIENSRWEPRNDQAGINEGERLTYYQGTTPEQCQADCDGNPRCKAYTYIRAGHYNPNDPPMCYLMSEAQKLSPSPCCISAIKR